MRVFMQALAQFLAVLSCGLFAGAAVYITLVEHPARMECENHHCYLVVILANWKPWYAKYVAMARPIQLIQTGTTTFSTVTCQPKRRRSAWPRAISKNTAVALREKILGVISHLYR